MFLFAAPLLAAPNERQVTLLADGVYAIQHPFGNSGNTTVIIGDRQVFVVDSPNYPAFAREDIAQIRQWTYMRWMHLDFSGGEATTIVPRHGPILRVANRMELHNFRKRRERMGHPRVSIPPHLRVK